MKKKKLHPYGTAIASGMVRLVRTDGDSHVHFYAIIDPKNISEDLDDWFNGPGWYWWDEIEIAEGPYPSYDEALAVKDDYAKVLREMEQ